MADVKPLKLVDHGDGAGRLEEFGAADKVPAENLPATEWTAETVPQAEAEAGTAQTRRAWTSQRVRQAIAAWWNGSGAKTQLDAVSSGITSLQASKLDATANLTALSGLAGAADRLPYFTGAGALSLTTLTELARNLLDDTTQSGMQSTLGLGTASTRTALGTTGALYSRDSILGTVSQSGDVPTGAIIERGSNANGEYVRWADGTQICVGGVVMPAGPVNTQLSVRGTYAAAFSTTPRVLHATQAGASGNGLQVSNGELNYNGVFLAVTSSFCDFQCYTYRTEQSTSVNIGYTATGRWF